MKIYRVAVVEDNPNDKQFLLDLIGRVPFLTLAGSFDDPLMALPFLTTEPVDLLLLDLHLPNLSGYELLRSLPNPPAVILTTSSLADSLEAFNVGAVDYLVKPIRYERFLRAVNRAITNRQTTALAPPAPQTMFLKVGHDMMRINVEEIRFVEASGQQSRIYLANQVLTVSHLLSDLAERLPTDTFIRIHRSYIISVGGVSRYSSRSVWIGSHELPVGTSYLAALKAVLE